MHRSRIGHESLLLCLALVPALQGSPLRGLDAIPASARLDWACTGTCLPATCKARQPHFNSGPELVACVEPHERSGHRLLAVRGSTVAGRFLLEHPIPLIRRALVFLQKAVACGRLLVSCLLSSFAVGVVQVRGSQGRRGRDTGSYVDRGERREVRAWAARTVKRLRRHDTRFALQPSCVFDASSKTAHWLAGILRYLLVAIGTVASWPPAPRCSTGQQDARGSPPEGLGSRNVRTAGCSPSWRHALPDRR